MHPSQKCAPEEGNLEEKRPSALLIESFSAGDPWVPPYGVLEPGTALATSLSRQDLLAGQAETLWSQLPLLWAAR